MNTVPKGKIGRLPKAIQEQVNRRMENGEKAKALLAWLNCLPEAQAVMAAQFNGVPVSEHNLSQWRKYGYKNWLWRREAEAMAAEPGALPVAGSEPLMEQMTGWASVYYLMAVRELVERKTKGPSGTRPQLKVLREFCRDVVALQRGEHSSARLKLEEERLAWRAVAASQALKSNPAPGKPGSPETLGASGHCPGVQRC